MPCLDQHSSRLVVQSADRVSILVGSWQLAGWKESAGVQEYEAVSRRGEGVPGVAQVTTGARRCRYGKAVGLTLRSAKDRDRLNAPHRKLRARICVHILGTQDPSKNRPFRSKLQDATGRSLGAFARPPSDLSVRSA